MRIILLLCLTLIFLLSSGTPVCASDSVLGSFTILDSIPPSPITNLTAVSTASYSVKLRWTAPGDDGSVGTASYYEIPFSTFPITSENRWNSANTAVGAPKPKIAGSTQNFTVGGLLT